MAFRHPARGRIGVVIDARSGWCLVSHDRHSVPHCGTIGQYLRVEILMARAERRPGGASELTASGGMCSSLDPRATAAGGQMLMPSF